MSDTSLPNVVSAPALNLAEYIGDLDDLDITEEQKRELLTTLWWMMAAMVRMNCGVDSVIPAFQDALKRAQMDIQQSFPSPEFNAAATDAEKER